MQPPTRKVRKLCTNAWNAMFVDADDDIWLGRVTTLGDIFHVSPCHVIRFLSSFSYSFISTFANLAPGTKTKKGKKYVMLSGPRRIPRLPWTQTQGPNLKVLVSAKLSTDSRRRQERVPSRFAPPEVWEMSPDAEFAITDRKSWVVPCRYAYAVGTFESRWNVVFLSQPLLKWIDSLFFEILPLNFAKCLTSRSAAHKRWLFKMHGTIWRG